MGLEKIRQGVNRQWPHSKLEWQMRVSEELKVGFTLRPARNLFSFYVRLDFPHFKVQV